MSEWREVVAILFAILIGCVAIIGAYQDAWWSGWLKGREDLRKEMADSRKSQEDPDPVTGHHSE